MTEAVTSGPRLMLDVLDDLVDVSSILDEWRALAATSAKAPVEAPDWLYPLAKHYLASYKARVLTWRDDEGRLRGIAPFSLVAERPRVRPVRQLALWGAIGPRLRGLVDVLADDEARAAVLDGLAAWLRANREWDMVRINRPQYRSSTPVRLRAEATKAGWTYAPFFNVRSTTYQIDLPPTVELWDRHLRPTDRRSLLARRRRFESFRHGELAQSVDTSDLGPILDAFEPLLAQRWGPDEIYFRHDAQFRALLHDAIPELVKRDAAWISVVRDDSGIVAALISLAWNRNAMSLLMVATADPDYRQYSLGAQIHDIAIREAVTRGCHTYDLLWGGPYKETFWRAEPRALEGAFIGRGVVGRAAALAYARRENRVDAGPS